MPSGHNKSLIYLFNNDNNNNAKNNKCPNSVFIHFGYFFRLQVDNPLFHITKQGDTIRAHKDHRIVVGFDGNDSGSRAAVMGKLIVSCARSAGGSSNIQWIYYLKGITP